jgi:hypothetical protein
MHALGFPRCLDRHGFYHAQEFGRDRGVDARSAKAHAAIESAGEMPPLAAIDGSSRRPPGIGDGNGPSAAAAGQHADE